MKTIILSERLSRRRQNLGITVHSLSRMSKVPVATVNRILVNPGSVRFDHVMAVGRVLGVDFDSPKGKKLVSVLRDRAKEKAKYVAKLVQGTQGLEASAVDPEGYERIVGVATEKLLSGKRRKLWDED